MDYISQHYYVDTQKKKSPSLQTDSTPAKCLTLGVRFEPKLAQYTGYAQEVALYYPRPSNTGVSESG